MNKLTISIGNNKIGNTLNFSVTPHLTCSDNCEFKVKGCYAKRICAFRKNVATCYENNYINTLKSDFVNKFKVTMDCLTSGVKYEFFRWHVAGDVYSQDYLNKIYSICKKYKGIKFFLPTASWDEGLDFKGKPSNLVIKNSFGSNIHAEQLNNFKSSYVLKKDDKLLHEKKFMKGKFICLNDCNKCRQCWNEKLDIIFIKH